jgi:hypothetical protein
LSEIERSGVYEEALVLSRNPGSGRTGRLGRRQRSIRLVDRQPAGRLPLDVDVKELSRGKKGSA